MKSSISFLMAFSYFGSFKFRWLFLQVVLINTFFLQEGYATSEDLAVIGVVKEQALIRYNGKHYKLKINEKLLEDVFVVSIDMKKKSVAISVKDKIHVYPFGYGTAARRNVVVLKTDESGVHRAKGKVNSQNVSFIVDTGATYVSLNSHLAKDLGVKYNQINETRFAETANGIVEVKIIELESVEVSGIVVRNVEAAIHEGDFPMVPLLGMSFLRNIEFQSKHSELTLIQ